MKRMRIGLIEIGSRAVRYVVLEVSSLVRDFSLIDKANKEHQINPSKITLSDVQMLNSLVQKLTRDIDAHSCDVVCVYGTQLCRSIKKLFPKELLSSVRTLSTEEESMAAWAAAFVCEGEENNQDIITAIDIGNSSTEIVRGRWDGVKIVDLKSLSFKAGSSQLMGRYKANRLSYFRMLEAGSSTLNNALREADIDVLENGRVYLAGGVATKIAWLQERENLLEVYKPERVNGAEVLLDDLSNLFLELDKAYASNPRECQKLVDSRRGSEEEVLRVLSGAPYILSLVRSVHAGESLFVSGYGLRHGMAYLLKHELLEA